MQRILSRYRLMSFVALTVALTLILSFPAVFASGVETEEASPASVEEPPYLERLEIEPPPAPESSESGVDEPSQAASSEPGSGENHDPEDDDGAADSGEASEPEEPEEESAVEEVPLMQPMAAPLGAVPVTDEAGLIAALTAVPPAQHIKLVGTITLSATLDIHYGVSLYDGTLKSSGAAPMITITAPGDTVVLDGVTFDGGGSVGAVEGYDGTLNVVDCVFQDLRSANGAAIVFRGESLQIEGSRFVNCSASGNGGAVFWAGDDLSIDDSLFLNCAAGGVGGAIYLMNQATYSIGGDDRDTVWFYDCVAYASGNTIGGPRGLDALYPNALCVTLDPNGGSVSPHQFYYNPNEVTVLTLDSFPVPDRTGYEFQGWQWDEPTSGAREDWNGCEIDRDFTLYAVWRQLDDSSSEDSSSSAGGSSSRSGGGGTTSVTSSAAPPTTTIDDEDVPLAELPVFIGDEAVPLADNPPTGLPFGLKVAMAASVSAMVVILGSSAPRKGKR